MQNNQAIKLCMLFLAIGVSLSLLFSRCKSYTNCTYCMKQDTTYLDGRIVNTRWIVNDSSIFGNSNSYDSAMNIIAIIPYEFDKIQGIIQVIDSLGNHASLGSWVLDNKEGPFIKFNANGSPKSIYYYKNNVLNGNAFWYDSTGNLLRYMYFNDMGHLLFTVNYNDEANLFEGRGIINAEASTHSKAIKVNQPILLSITIAKPPGYLSRITSSVCSTFDEVIQSESIDSITTNEISHTFCINESGKYYIKIEYLIYKINTNVEHVSTFMLNNIIVE